MKHLCHCSYCNKAFYRYTSQIKNKVHIFCSKRCQGNMYKLILQGKNNGNYGKHWSTDLREHVSNKMKLYFSLHPEAKLKCASNKGKKLLATSKKLRQYYQTHAPYMKGKRHTEKTKELIGIKSKQKFTDDYRKKQRMTFESIGKWVKLQDKSDWEIYSKESNWKSNMFNLITNKAQLNLLKKYGVFSSFTNTKGIVRDHKYSRRSGFINKVFPEILRHPVNCALIKHVSNVRKANHDSITLKQLFNRIKRYKGGWPEQQLVLNKIKDYESGLRWENKYKREVC